MGIPVTAIFDIGKTNKKFYLFDTALQEVHQEYKQFDLVEDDDGYLGEDLESLTHWMQSTLQRAVSNPAYTIRAMNISGYGASMVHLDAEGKPATPLYNYLKPFPAPLLEAFFKKYGGETQNNVETASPTLGMLNSGLQLYWIQQTKPKVFSTIRHALHFPQYLSYIFTGEICSEPTSVGCHTRLWDFKKHDYHRWVKEEHLEHLFPEIVPSTTTFPVTLYGQKMEVGVGIHDSSAALVPYILGTTEPFLLISTGTWNITLNPFTKDPLTLDELSKDCLLFLDINGKPVKASRLFLGNEFSHQRNKLAAIFDKPKDAYKNIQPDPAFLEKAASGEIEDTFYPETVENKGLLQGKTNRWHPENFSSYEEAYHYLNWGLVCLQALSLQLAKGQTDVKKVFIDGGFVHNPLFLAMLKIRMPEFTFITTEVTLGSYVGAALVLGEKASSSQKEFLASLFKA